MAYQNFIPTVWAEAINRDLERAHVFVADTNRQYEGDVKQKGDSVRILGVGKPTITTQTGKKITLNGAEDVADQSITLNINQVAYFNYKVDDIDKRQAVGGLMEALSKETSEGLADVMDKFVANMSLAKEAVVFNSTATTISKDNILTTIDDMLVKLLENDVKRSSKITLTLPPKMAMILKQAYVDLDTDNSKKLENGVIGKYNGILIKESNNCATDTSGNYMVQLKTDRAIAFVNPMTHIEPYRPENGFSDAVKGFILYDGIIARPKELIVGRWK
jgi:hypothetical protein